MRCLLPDLCTRRRVVPALVLLALVTLCGCGGGSGNIHGNGTSGVRGTVTSYVGVFGGINPPVGAVYTPMPNVTVVVQQTQSGGNPSIKVTPGLGPVLAQTTTDAQGHYSIPLAPGGYVVSVFHPEPNRSHRGVNVVAGQFMTQDIVVDINAP